MHCDCKMKYSTSCPCLCHICEVRKCKEPATWQIEITGFFKQFMCDEHTSSFEKVIIPSCIQGIESLKPIDDSFGVPLDQAEGKSRF